MPSEKQRRSAAPRARKPSASSAAAAASAVPKKRPEPSAVETAAAASAVPKKRREPSAVKTAAAPSVLPKKRREPSAVKTAAAPAVKLAAAASEVKTAAAASAAKPAAALAVPMKRRERSAVKTDAAALAVPKKRREPSAAKSAAAAWAVPKKRRRNKPAEEAEGGAAAGATSGDANKEAAGLAFLADEVGRAVALGDALIAGCEPKSGSDEDAELSVGENASEDNDGDGDDDGDEKELSRRDLLKGIDVSDSSDGEDSSDDERVQELPTVEAPVCVQPASNTKRGVVYLGRIPPGFYEKQMREYFSQFGEVTRLRLARNKKTGRSKQYAFIEFRSEDVAKIICDTMHNYLLSGRLLQCKLIPAASVHPKTFAGAGKQYRAIDHYAVARKQHNAKKTKEGIRKALEKEKVAAKKKAKKLRRSGIDYQFDG
ncbi:MAG: hypothetical protein BJ554DRAFT_6912 [Olpidium bornovanus]|uniref:RRM domain-containing protein n=1 Tax=Olpidium bornovanus TaxID=278681 RepID=A0A8H8DJV4_9FUNG|nr:MAG: hypothetical protein BJ554DRAFT_6912 [Olpidium bornovanus]